jgi:tape measure domain-containing protein
MSTIGRNLTNNLTIPLAATSGAAVAAFAQFERLSKGLETVVGSSTGATRELSKLTKAAQNPGLSLNQAVSGSIKLQSVGLSADQARESLLQFGNALALAGGTSADLDGVSLALTQIISKGKISAEEINQLAERVPQVRRAIQDAFGTADSEQLQKLGISAEEFVEKVTAEFAKLPRAQNTLSNSFNNLSQSVNLALVRIGEEINKTFDLQGLVERLTAGVTKVVDLFTRLDDKTKRTILIIGGVTAAIGPVALAVGSLTSVVSSAVSGLGLLVGAFKAVAVGSISLFANPVGLAVGAAAALGAVAIYVADNWEVTKNRLAGILTLLANQFISAFNEIIAVYNGLAIASNIFQPIALQFDLLDIPKFEGQFKSLGETVKSVGKNLLGLVGISFDPVDTDIVEDGSTGSPSGSSGGGGGGTAGFYLRF